MPPRLFARHIRPALVLIPILLSASFAPRAQGQGTDTVWLDSLDLSKMNDEWGAPHPRQSVLGNPIDLRGTVFSHGVGVCAHSEMLIDLKGSATRFTATVGVDDEKKKAGSVSFEVWVDGHKTADTGVVRGGEPVQFVSVDLIGAHRLMLITTDGGDGLFDDSADWADAQITLTAGATEKPETLGLVLDPLPVVGTVDMTGPAIHGPRVVGATPGRPFLFLIPATGVAPLTFHMTGLPDGLTLDPKTGIVSGALKKPGRTVVDVAVSNARGVTHRPLLILGGDHVLAQTPSLGWSSWNVWGETVDAQKVRDAADWMVRSGLAAHGYNTVQIDDCWQGGRSSDGTIQPNDKFSDMRMLADYIHTKGLKAGIYSSPGPQTCEGKEGSYEHEAQDAQTFARWGYDYLKYDWCSYGGVAKDNSVAELAKPYLLMRQALDQTGRDIVFSFCQYGIGNVWEWGARAGGNSWRTTGDSADAWGRMISIGFEQAGRERYAGPGHWNDQDILTVGKLGWGHGLHPTSLTPNEQITHLTLWCLESSPLLVGCDLSQLDPFTLSLLTDDEVLDVNQDPLGQGAGRRARQGLGEVWARPLWDGTTAVGLFNRSMEPMTVTAHWTDLGLAGRRSVRDLWRRQDLGNLADTFTALVPAHGAVLVKIGAPTGRLSGQGLSEGDPGAFHPTASSLARRGGSVASRTKVRASVAASEARRSRSKTRHRR